MCFFSGKDDFSVTFFLILWFLLALWGSPQFLLSWGFLIHPSVYLEQFQEEIWDVPSHP